MGTVYRALDLKRGVQVALKTMRRVDPTALYRFKQEFRAVQGLVHPNLVGLYELESDGYDWFLTMELVEGVDFLRYVRGGLAGRGAIDREGERRLRGATVQLAEGLIALHDAGVLHRDIKPTNVLVTSEGLVKVLDFGLAAAFDAGEQYESTAEDVVGTIAYMAPEQAAGAPVGPATDWYAVGVMLFEALTGRRPFVGSPFEVLSAKRSRESPRAQEFAMDVPPELADLSALLLLRDPTARPSGKFTVGQLRGRPSEPDRAERASAVPLVGRAEHLTALADALDQVRRRRTVVVRVHGPSGAGKSTLIGRFLDSLEAESRTVVLAGRCYEQESVPYKALDSVIDSLSRHLRRLTAAEVAAILPRDVSPLTRLFPVLRRVEALEVAPRQAAEIADAQELRRRAFAALRELLGRLGDRATLVIAVDDLQWGDVDSAALLSELLRPPDPPTLLLLACHRSEDAESPFVRALLDVVQTAWIGLDRRELAVLALGAAEALDLATRLTAADGAAGRGRAERIARESGGNALFLMELARRAPTAGDTQEISLERVLWRRIEAARPEERLVLELVAVSGRPLRCDDLGHLLGPGGDERGALAALRAGRLVRGTVLSDGEEVEVYHDKVRETVVAHLAPASVREHHRRLALVLEGSGHTDPEALGVHFRDGGEPERAGGYFALAAARASKGLAFDRGAKLYRLALELLPRDAAGESRLRAALAEALANAGRGAEAAREYMAAAEGAGPAVAFEHRRRAAMQYLISGHIDEGLDALRSVLADVGMRLPKSPREALSSMLWRRAWLRLRGLGFRPRAESAIDPADLARVDVCWSAGIGLSVVETIQGAAFQTRALLAAVRAGEPARVARALAMEAAHTASAGVWAHARTERLLAAASELAAEVKQPYALAMVELARTASAYLEGRWRDSVGASDAAQGVFRDRCTGVAWEIDTAASFGLWALSHLGDVAELARRWPVLLHEARERGDRYAVMNLSTYLMSVVRLAADEPDEAMRGVLEIGQAWSRRGYHVQHNDQAWATAQIHLYRGDGPSAWALLEEIWPSLRRSLLLRVQFIRTAMLQLRARSALAAAEVAGAPEPLLIAAARDARRLEREGTCWSNAAARLVHAGIAARRGDRRFALAHLEAAVRGFETADMALYSAAARRMMGELKGGDEGARLIAAADGWMTAQAIRQPARIAWMYAPGFSAHTRSSAVPARLETDDHHTKAAPPSNSETKP
jgi:hypothetical protein